MQSAHNNISKCVEDLLNRKIYIVKNTKVASADLSFGYGSPMSPINQNGALLRTKKCRTQNKFINDFSERKTVKAFFDITVRCELTSCQHP